MIVRPFVPLLILLSLAGLAASDGAQPSSIGQLPGEKVPAALIPKERNPFTRDQIKPTITADHESEESRLRALFASMHVTGFIRGGPSPEVLLGSLILRPDHPVPRLLENQTEHLVVGAVSPKQVEILFVETEARAEPRRILIPIDLHPHVSVRLPTLPTASAKPVNAAPRVPE